MIFLVFPSEALALAETTGRKPGNLSRTLKTMSNYGIVEMKRELDIAAEDSERNRSA